MMPGSSRLSGGFASLRLLCAVQALGSFRVARPRGRCFHLLVGTRLLAMLGGLSFMVVVCLVDRSSVVERWPRGGGTDGFHCARLQ